MVAQRRADRLVELRDDLLVATVGRRSCLLGFRG